MESNVGQILLLHIITVVLEQVQYVNNHCDFWFLIFSVPIGIISNLTVEIDSSTSVRVSWLPINPSNWNGIVTVYVVVYERQGPAGSVNAPTESYVTSTASIPFLPEHPLANNPDPRLVTMPLNVESLQLRGLEENYVYEFTVYCENTAGRSDSSNPVIITMPSSGNVFPSSTSFMTIIMLYPQKYRREFL